MPDGTTRTPLASRLPVPLSRVAATPSAGAAGAEFLSQLIAERDHLPPQRERRRATMTVAVGSYHAAAEQAVRRLPPGYRTSFLA